MYKQNKTYFSTSSCEVFNYPVRLSILDMQEIFNDLIAAITQLYKSYAWH